VFCSSASGTHKAVLRNSP